MILLLQLAVNSKSQNLLETFDLASVKRGLQVQVMLRKINQMWFLKHVFFWKYLQEAHDDVGRRVARWLQNQPPISYQEIPGDLGIVQDRK